MTTKQTRDSPMSAITVVEFERKTLPSETYLSELEEEPDDGPPYTIHGVALGAGDVTKGSSGIKKKWPADELREAADTLQGTSLVVNHENTAEGVVGRVTKAGYKDGTGVVYEAELYDEELAEKIENGLLEVSVRGLHADVSALEKDDETGAIEIEDIEFENLSIVPSGAAPSNTLEVGEHAELSEAELTAFTEELSGAGSQMALESLEPGDFVKWGDKRGVILTPTEGEEKVTVDVYEKVDDKWRSVGKTETVDLSSLEKWGVSEDNIGARKEDEEENASGEADAELSSPVEKGDWVQYEDYDGALNYGRVIGIQKQENRRVAKVQLWQNTDSGWMKTGDTAERPSATLEDWSSHPEPSGNMEEEAAAVERGQFVKWKDVDDSWRHGQIIDIDQVGTSMIATLHHFTKSGDKLDETERKPVQGLNKWDWSPDTIKSKESTVRQSEPSESNSGGGVGVDEVVNFLSKFVEENATTTKDVPVDEAQPTHDSMDDDEERTLIGDMTIEEFVKSLSHIDSSELSANVDADISEMTVSELADADRVEGEEEPLDANQLTESRANETRYIDEEDAEELEDDTSADEGENDSKTMTSESSDVEAKAELQDYSFHRPEYSGTTTQDWDEPALEDFLSVMDTDAESWDDLTQDQKQEVGQHFLVSASGFPAENFSDMKLPVVEPSGELNVNALAAVKGGHGADAVDGLSDEMVNKIDNLMNELANEKFDRSWGEEENTASEVSDGKTGDSAAASLKMAAGVRVLPGDDLRDEISGASESDSMTKDKVLTMTDEIEEKLAELEEPVAVEAEELQQLQEKADRLDELSDNIEALRERTEVLDEVDRSQVEELRDSDDPIVVESARYEELQDEAEEVKSVYAASLAEEMPGFDAEELADSFGIEELREKHEDVKGSIDEELSSSEEAEPRSQDPSEEELEEASSDEETDEAELSDDAQAKQEELLNKITNGQL